MFSMSQRTTQPSHDLLARLVPGRIHVLVGGPGTGKTALCLRFLTAGLAAGEHAAMLVMARGADVKAHAQRIGLELDGALRFERLMLLRYRPDFGERRARAASPIQAIEELERLLSSVQPSRIVIDSFAPLLGDEPGSSHAIAALAAYLERSGATSLLTYPEDVSNGYDRRLEPVMQSAAAILRLERRTHDDTIQLHALNTRAESRAVVGRDADHTFVTLTS
jgi:KaiC/GvpD/RAD55 family RecA-like ATPase